MQQERVGDLGALGNRLSVAIDCPVYSPSFGKNVFTCHHRIMFSISRLRANSDWAWTKQLHDKGLENRK